MPVLMIDPQHQELWAAVAWSIRQRGTRLPGRGHVPWAQYCMWTGVCAYVRTETEQLHCFSPLPTAVPQHSRAVMEWND